MLAAQEQIRYDMWLAFDKCEKHELSATGELLPVVEPVDAAALVAGNQDLSKLADQQQPQTEAASSSSAAASNWQPASSAQAASTWEP